jgi:predicted TIM-barrel fold metal-dependent hydrolase
MTAEPEPPLEPERPIIDPHLHIWEVFPPPEAARTPWRFLLPDAAGMIADSGHNVTHTVFVECHAMYRKDGPVELRSLGETEFANGVAAMSATGAYGRCLVADRILGAVDLRLGAAAAPVLEAHMARAGDRFRGVRCQAVFSEEGLFGRACDPSLRGMMLDEKFREGVRALANAGLGLDVWCVHSQFGELADLADAMPDLTIVLDHLGAPEPRGPARAAETRAEWARGIAELARRPNLRIKLGGLGMDLSRPIGRDLGQAGSEALAARWRPYAETCVEAFTPKRCMFESNFPPDRTGGSYGATWNAFKLIARGCSEEEKDQLFRRTAAQTYRIALADPRAP